MMSWQAVEAVFQYSQSKGAARLLLLCIAHHAQPDGTNARVAQPTLEAETKIDRRGVQRYIKALEQLGELEAISGNGRTSSTYRVLLPLRAILSGVSATAPVSLTGGSTTASDTSPQPPVQEQTVVETSVVSERKQTTTGRAQLLADLEAEGVAQSVALDLITNPKYLQRVPLQLACLNDRDPKDRAAVLVASIKGNWGPPKAYVQRQKQQESAQVEATKRQQIVAEEKERKAHNVQVLADTEAQNAALDAKYLQLSETERAELDATAKERLGVLGASGRAQAALIAMRRNLLREREGHHAPS